MQHTIYLMLETFVDGTSTKMYISSDIDGCFAITISVDNALTARTIYIDKNQAEQLIQFLQRNK